MRMSDILAQYINELLNEADGIAEIQRNDLANQFGCVPSQINYVITSRFTPEQGYSVESRRGGGGYIRISRRRLCKSDFVMHIINSIGDRLDAGTARAMIDNLYQNQLVTAEEGGLIKAAISDRALSPLPKEWRDEVRASIFKTTLLATKE
ncbi:CtsR family transcriptional regulator [Scatolibacter rhodanostii]|uniref:CtsR family transcriptional regulator n=1 Tax=Scatolibacter rhodanostii TaxID=2014781 RepID=UPI000C082D8F|nr:CtsR family transcriptional regulator [Scatolibacter rhodanostii]